MGLLDLIRTYKDASFPFYELKERAIEVYQMAYNKGFSNPLYGDLEIVKENDGYSTTIRFFYESSNEGKAQKFEKKEHYGDLEDIPALIANAIKQDGKVQIKLKNFMSLLSSKDLNVKGSIKFSDLESIINDIKIKNHINSCNTSIKIIDELFYTRVIISFTNANGQIKRFQTAYRTISNYPKDVWDEIIESEDGSITLNIK